LLVTPFALFVGWMLITAPEAFSFDLRYTLARLNTLTLLNQIANIGRNITVLLAQDGWMMAGIIGLCLLRPGHLRAAALALLIVPVIVLGRTVALYSLSAHYMTPLLPLVALGVATLVRYGVVYVAEAFTPINLVGTRPAVSAHLIRFGHVAAVILIATPLLTATAFTLENVRGRFPTAIDPFLIDPADARVVIDFLNIHADESDVVIASPPVGWALRANAADFQMSVAADGMMTPHLPGDIPAERLAFDPRFSAADYVVIDNWWHSWGALHVPTLADKLHEVEATWTLVFESGTLRVYASGIAGASITPIAQYMP
jgi:hypothetical protein